MSPPQERVLLSKVTWRLIPLLFLCHIVAYVDRINVGFAKLHLREAARDLEKQQEAEKPSVLPPGGFSKLEDLGPVWRPLAEPVDVDFVQTPFDAAVDHLPEAGGGFPRGASPETPCRPGRKAKPGAGRRRPAVTPGSSAGPL